MGVLPPKMAQIVSILCCYVCRALYIRLPCPAAYSRTGPLSDADVGVGFALGNCGRTREELTIELYSN